MASSEFMKVRKNGEGADGKKKPVLFPKLVFLYDENVHGKGKKMEWLFDEAIDCSSKAMYPREIIGASYRNICRKLCEPRNLGCQNIERLMQEMAY